MGILRQLTLLAWPNVQFWKTEKRWRLDSSHHGCNYRDIPGLVDAADVCAVKASERGWVLPKRE